ncbi:MAG: PAS domain S-box protein, partial [Proteobacteria bacterium]|nr:PAS domain S-box protein [Pseudomonadota bacterium]
QFHTLYISDILSVAEVWINGQAAVSGGQVGKNKEREIPHKHALLARFQTTGTITEIMLHVSNFSNREGGINTPIWLGPDHQIQQKTSRIWITTAFMGGALLLVGLYHLALFSIRRNEDSNLYFGLYCVMWASQTLFGVNTGCLMAELFPSLPWRMSIDATLLPFGVMPALMVMFYHALFPNRRAETINRISQILGVLFVIYILLTPPNAFDPMLLYFLLIQAGTILYLFGMFIHDLVKKKENIHFLIPGYLLLALTCVNDILNDLHIINTANLVPFGAFFFILSYSFLISVRFSRAFSAVEQLTGRLRQQNRALSQAVDTATENLRLKKELDIREKRELKLKVMQGRLSSMLNRVEDALVAITPEQKIIFSNQAVKALTGYEPNHLLGKALGDLLPQLSGETYSLFVSQVLPPVEKHLENVAVNCLGHPPLRVDITASLLDLENEELMVMILKKARKEPLPPSEPLKLISQLNRNQGRIEKADNLLNRQNRENLTGEEQETLNTLIQLLDKIQDPPSDSPNAEAKRLLGVQVMNASCTLWAAATRTTNTELADKSGFWSIYIEKDGYARTQTLNKYLNIATLPARPRWKTILNTAEFVLAACEESEGLKKNLKTQVTRLKNCL